ncbi:helix-turn-helix domain-containing protein [Streptomyces sp. NPDC002004]
MAKSRPGPGPAALHGPATDLGRRAAARREELGLTREEVAERCGAAPSYIQYIEEHAAMPGIGVILRLAEALETTVGELTGHAADLPPGRSSAPRTMELRTLDAEECRALLSTHGVGRVGVTTEEGPAIVPVNYVVAEGEIAFRTAPDALPSAAADARGDVAFEVDHIDDACSQGWSVLVVGPARAVTDDATVGRLEAEAPSLPWAGGRRGRWLAITPVRITGRRVVNPQSGLYPDPGTTPGSSTRPDPGSRHVAGT